MGARHDYDQNVRVESVALSLSGAGTGRVPGTGFLDEVGLVEVVLRPVEGVQCLFAVTMGEVVVGGEEFGGGQAGVGGGFGEGAWGFFESGFQGGAGEAVDEDVQVGVGRCWW